MNADSLSRFLHEMREYLPLLIFLVVTPIVLYASHKSRQKQIRNLRELAAKLGLQFNDPERKNRQLPARLAPSRPGESQMPADIERRISQSGLLRTIFSMAEPLEVYGKYNGFQVNLRLVRRNKKNFTEARAAFSAPLGMGLKIARAGFWNRSLTLDKTARVESGHAELDKTAVIQARDGLRARYVAKNLQAQLALLELFRNKGAEVGDQGARVEQDGHQTEYPKAKKLLDDMTRALQAVETALGRAGASAEKTF